MAITQVRVQFDGQWMVMVRNPETGYYEARLTPSATSALLPGGYYNVAVEVTNDSGQTSIVNGQIFKGLRLVAKEQNPPSLALISPATGYLTTATPEIIVEAADTESGIPADGLRMTVDGADVPFDAAAIPDGWRITYTPAAPLPEGPHTVTATATDRDGNVSELVLPYIVDTVPPSLALYTMYQRRVVDDTEITLAGRAEDATSGIYSLRVTGSAGAVEITPGPDGSFTAAVPLSIGVNDLVVTARDAAGLETVETIRIIRLITDRDETDAPAVEAYYSKPIWEWSEAEKAEFLADCLYGGYDEIAMNRVGEAVALLTALLRELGIGVSTTPKTDWRPTDAATVSPSAAYIENVRRIRDVFGLYAPLPSSLESLDWDWANLIEQALVGADSVIPRAKRGFIASNEAMCGEF